MPVGQVPANGPGSVGAAVIHDEYGQREVHPILKFQERRDNPFYVPCLVVRGQDKGQLFRHGVRVYTLLDPDDKGAAEEVC